MGLHHHACHHHTHHAPHPDAAIGGAMGDYARLVRLASYASVLVALILVLAKGIAWWVSDSLAMLSSLTDSFFDLLTSAVNFIAVRYALKPPDDDHRYGHTGIEDIAGIVQFLMIVGSLAVIGLQSVERLFNPHPLQREILGMAVTGFSLVLTSALVVLQTYVTRKTRSIVIASDRMHYLSDLLFNLGVLTAFGCSYFWGIAWADPVLALMIVALVLYHTREIGIRAFNNLMNREMPDSDKARIQEVIAGIAEVQHYHTLKTRYLGAKAIVQVRIDLARDLAFEEAHAITHRLELAIAALFADAEVIVHADPV
jgi:ferrous-iron efflux pump FieF